MRSRDDLPAGGRLLVRGIAARPHAGRCDGMPLPRLSACQDCSFAEGRQNRRRVKFQSIWTVGPPVVPAPSARRARTAAETLYKHLGAAEVAGTTGGPT